jgi:hypothetical protein
MSTVVHIAIGNSDDRLTQERWSRYFRQVDNAVRHWAPVVHGTWHSLPDHPWQNACWAFVPPSHPTNLKHLTDALRKIAALFDQESISWNESETEFITTKET